MTTKTFLSLLLLAPPEEATGRRVSGYLLRNEISEVLETFKSKVKNSFLVEARFTKDNNLQSIYAIKQFIMENNLAKDAIQIIDGVGNVTAEPALGWYRFHHIRYGYIWINLDKEETIIYGLRCYNTPLDLKDWQNSLMEKYCSPRQCMRYYMINHQNKSYSWKFCTTRPLIKLINLNHDYIKEFKESVKRFINNRYQYDGRPYRYGYLLYGPKGSHKTLMSKYLASKYKRPIYNLNLTSGNLSDNDLEQLLANVPANSIILMDELDIMLENVLKDERSKLTNAGLQKALAGPIELQDGVIVIVTTNDFQRLNELIPSLCREGRIDETIEFSNRGRALV